MICPNCSTIEEEVPMEEEDISKVINGTYTKMTAYWCCGCGYGKESVHDHPPINPYIEDMGEW